MAAKKKMYLHTSPEYYMKKLLARGWDKIFQICRVFRDGEFGHTHQIEFTMLEWYRTHADYRKIMEDCEGLLHYLSREVLGRTRLSYQGKIIDLIPAGRTGECVQGHENLWRGRYRKKF